MATSGTGRIIRKAFLLFISFLISSMYLILAALVLMFLMSTLNLINPELFQFKSPGFLTIILTGIVIVFSLRAFAMAFKRIYNFLDS